MSDIVKTSKLGPLKVGFAARVDNARKTGTLATDLFDHSRYSNRIILVIDDSGSMSSLMEPVPGNSVERFTEPKDTRMSTCRKACEEFLNVCDSRDTALGMYTISTGKEYPLTNLYIPLLGYIRELQDSGSTPTIATLDKVITKEKVTRVVLVSDGESGALLPGTIDNEGCPNLRHLTQTAQAVINKYKERKIPIDTVFIGQEHTEGHFEMETIAYETDGLYLFFKSGESFRSKFKYLAPAFRGMLVAGEVKL
jgi:hypothetical protein